MIGTTSRTLSELVLTKAKVSVVSAKAAEEVAVSRWLTPRSC